MGNLEKAGVLVVVALLAVILVVAFLNFPDQNSKAPPMLGASIGKSASAEQKKPKPTNVLPTPSTPEVIRPKPDPDRLATDAPPRVIDPPPPGVSTLPPAIEPKDPKRDELVVNKTPITPPKPEPDKTREKSASSPVAGYPKMVKVQHGESLWAIAVREYGPRVGPRMLGAIADANPKVRPEVLKAGTELSLPAPPSEIADAKPRPEPAPKAAPSPAKSPTAQPAKSTRKLPFLPNGN
jgi:LysM repeat protein